MASTTRTRYTDAELLEAVREVALMLPTRPESLPQGTFDAKRRDVAATYPHLPTARAICMRLNSGSGGHVAWASIVRAALTGGAAVTQTISAARAEAPEVPVSDPETLPVALLASKGARWSDIHDCADAVLAYWDTLPGTREPTQKGYGAWAVGKPYPAPGNFAQHGGFRVVRELAREKRRGRNTPA